MGIHDCADKDGNIFSCEASEILALLRLSNDSFIKFLELQNHPTSHDFDDEEKKKAVVIIKSIVF